MRAEEQTSRHLLLAVIVTVFSVTLSLITIAMAWESWVVPLTIAGCFSVWLLHIARVGSDAFYENLCAGLLLVEFFFFSVHETSLFDASAVACILILALFMLNKKWMLHTIECLYVVELLYHALILHTISKDMGLQAILRLGLGVVVVFGGTILARYGSKGETCNAHGMKKRSRTWKRQGNRAPFSCRTYLMSCAPPLIW